MKNPETVSCQTFFKARDYSQLSTTQSGKEMKNNARYDDRKTFFSPAFASSLLLPHSVPNTPLPLPPVCFQNCITPGIWVCLLFLNTPSIDTFSNTQSPPPLPPPPPPHRHPLEIGILGLGGKRP